MKNESGQNRRWGDTEAPVQATLVSAIRFVRCFRDAVARATPTAMASLEEAVSRIADEMRAIGQSPERGLIELKSLLQNQGPAGWSPSLGGFDEKRSARSEAQVYRQLFQWWLTAYYRPLTSVVEKMERSMERGGSRGDRGMRSEGLMGPHTMRASCEAR